MKVLLVEDDPMIGQAVHQGLREACYAVDWLRDGQTALDTLSHEHYDFVLLDLGLPKLDGMSVLARLRQAQRTMPVLILTARDEVEDRIQGLDQGADDYIVKPFALSELLARMRAVLRRHAGAASSELSNGTLTLDLLSREARIAEQEPRRLSAREFSLLQALLVRPGAILSRGELEQRIYGWGEEVESNAVEFLIHGLRKKLGPQVIKNVRGVGWMVAKEA